MSASNQNIDREEALIALCREATWSLSSLDQDDADVFVDNVLDAVMAVLRANPQVVHRTALEWSILFGNLRRRAADDLAEIIRGRVDLDEVIEAIAREIEADEPGETK